MLLREEYKSKETSGDEGVNQDLAESFTFGGGDTCNDNIMFEVPEITADDSFIKEPLSVRCGQGEYIFCVSGMDTMGQSSRKRKRYQKHW